MATSGTYTKLIGKASMAEVNLIFEWQRISYSVANNTSIISWTAKVKHSGLALGWDMDYVILVDGNRTSGNTTLTGSGLSTETDTIATGTAVCIHDNTGAKSFYFDFSVTFDDDDIKGGTIDGTVALDAIPVPATITHAPNFTDEDDPVITYSNPSGDLVDKLEACISLTGGKDNIPYREIPTDETSYTFYFTDEEREILQGLVTTGNSTTVRFYVRTTIEGVQYHSYLTKTLTIAGVETIINPTVIDVDSRTTKLTGDSSVFVKYFSDASFDFNTSLAKGSTVDSRYIICGSKANVDYYQETGTLYNVDDHTFHFGVTDSRGYSVKKDVTVYMIPYVKLTASLTLAPLTLAGNLTFTVIGNWFSGDFGTKYNTLEFEYGIQKNGGDISWHIIEPDSFSINGNKYTARHTITNLDPSAIYTVTVNVIDELMNAQTELVSVTSAPVFDWGKDDFRHNTPVMLTKSNSIRVTDDSGAIREVLNPLTSSNNVRLGFGNYDNADGDTNIYGDSISLKYNNNLTFNDVPIGGRVLWNGAIHMNGSQTITLSSKVSEQLNGIVLVFSGFDNTNGFPLDSSFNTFFISKKEVELLPGKSHSFFLLNNAGFSTIGAKYLVINDNTISGYNNTNSASGSNNGFNYVNHYFVLRYVIGV